MDKVVIVLLGICGALLGSVAYGSFGMGIGTGALLAFVFYYLIKMAR